MINLSTGALTGGEALLRWRHPTRGLLHPKGFVGLAEECGLIVPIGHWVLREACRQAQVWQDAGFRPISIAVNVSAVEFRTKDFLERLRAVLTETRLEPRYLELELTEGVLMADVRSTTTVLKALKDLGVQLAVDDFGTGYSSLSYLSRFPIDALKIDQSFVKDITMNPDDASIVSAVIKMAESLNQRVVAEGVETHAQLAMLRARHCEEAQGYYFSRPVTAEQFATQLAIGR